MSLRISGEFIRGNSKVYSFWSWLFWLCWRNLHYLLWTHNMKLQHECLIALDALLMSIFIAMIHLKYLFIIFSSSRLLLLKFLMTSNLFTFGINLNFNIIYYFHLKFANNKIDNGRSPILHDSSHVLIQNNKQTDYDYIIISINAMLVESYEYLKEHLTIR